MRLEGYSDYEIYPETGRVWSYSKNRFIGFSNPNGYCYVLIKNDNGKFIRWMIHRLVWTVVNGEIPEKMEINHIDENKNNNSIFNLNMLSHQDNLNWGTHNERVSKGNLNNSIKSKPVIAIKDENVVMYFPSTAEAGRKGFWQQNITLCCNGKMKTTGGYQWQYMDNYLADWWDNTYMS